MSAFADLGDIAPIAIWERVLARLVGGDECSLAVVELDPESVVAEHSHPNEQLGLVVSGTLTFRVGDEERDLAPGGTWRIPRNVPHEVHAGPNGAIVVDVFAPPRTDWQAVERADPRSPRWP
jgi:quercetin dioxygenase-like cupin family protein